MEDGGGGGGVWVCLHVGEDLYTFCSFGALRAKSSGIFVLVHVGMSVGVASGSISNISMGKFGAAGHGE